MEIITTIGALRQRLRNEKNLSFVPTMGNLHEGHIELMHAAKEKSGCAVASIFVNRLQFGPNEDFDKYPRTFTEDCEKLEAAGIDVLFAPDEKELYPKAQQITLNLPPLADELCGAYRPGHFIGMATIVLKLFHLIKPQLAVFGKKDFQQLFLIREMVRQLNLDIEIMGKDTARNEQGLALSSRNRYLSDAEKKEATRLYRNLLRIKHAIRSGDTDFRKLESIAVSDLKKNGWNVQYVEIRNEENLRRAVEKDDKLIALAAAFLGKTRLIDNIEI